MPSAPKIGHACRNIRVVEVFTELKTEYFTQADCHVGIPAKIKVNLQCVANNAYPSAEHRGVGGTVRLNGGVNRTEGVGKQ